MMRKVLVRMAVSALCAAALCLGGCVNLGKGTVNSTKLYVLSPMGGVGQATPAEGAESKLAIGVGPVELPPSLNRPQLVIRESQNEIKLEDFAHWAEPLGDNISGVLMENLAILLGTDRVVEFPRQVPMPIDYQVVVRVIRFDAPSDGNAQLVARWAVFAGEARKLLVYRKSSYTQPLGGPGADAMVAAQSKNLEGLSRDIAGAIRELPR